MLDVEKELHHGCVEFYDLQLRKMLKAIPALNPAYLHIFVSGDLKPDLNDETPSWSMADFKAAAQRRFLPARVARQLSEVELDVLAAAFRGESAARAGSSLPQMIRIEPGRYIRASDVAEVRERRSCDGKLLTPPYVVVGPGGRAIELTHEAAVAILQQLGVRDLTLGA